MRDYNQEHQDTDARKYAYDFDTVLRGYMMRSFGPFLPEGKALELGCFKGEFTRIIAKQYRDLTVVEASDELVACARTQVGEEVKFITSTFEGVALPDSGFDAVFLVHTLEHLDHPVAVLKRINSWLSRTGRAFVAVPNANAPSRQIAVKMGLMTHNAAITESEFAQGHRRTYALDTLEQDTVEAGLNIVHRGGVFFKPLANFQFDKLMGSAVMSDAYLEGCYKLGMQYPDLCASIFLVCAKG